MTDAKRDNNSVTVALGVKQSDGVTPSPFGTSDANSHRLQTNDGTSGTDQTGSKVLARDNNEVHVYGALSSDGLGTIVVLYLDASGKLLIKSS